MNDFCVSTNKEVARFGRMDAGFLTLYHAHKDLAEELLVKFGHADLVRLAQDLPFCEEAARRVLVRGRQYGKKSLADRFKAWVTSESLRYKARTTDLAVYCAAAAQQAAAKVLAQVEELTTQAAALSQGLRDLLADALTRKADRLFDAIRADVAEGDLEKYHKE